LPKAHSGAATTNGAVAGEATEEVLNEAEAKEAEEVMNVEEEIMNVAEAEAKEAEEVLKEAEEILKEAEVDSKEAETGSKVTRNEKVSDL